MKPFIDLPNRWTAISSRLIRAIALALLISSASFAYLQAQTNAPAPAADAAPPPGAAAQRSPAELEKLVAPIALHPDPLVAILLPASVYPLEIVQAARFVKDTNNIPKLDQQPWDENVKAVAKFPELIAKMDADISWTVELGLAFLDQRKEVMDMIQSLRGKAQKAGTLQTSPQQVVTVTNVIVLQTNITQVVQVTNQIVQVQPSNPDVIYVPSYPPTVYYPPPAYVYNPVAPLVTFGVGMAWGAIIANNCDWHHGDVDIDIDHNVNVDRDVNRNTERNTNRNTDRTRSSTQASGTKQKWQPDQSRLNKSGAPSASTQNREARGWGGGSGPQASQRPAGAAGTRPTSSQFSSPGASGNRSSFGQQSPGAGQRPSTSAGGSRPTQSSYQPSGGSRPSSSTGSRPSPSSGSYGQRSGGSHGSAFSGMGSGGGAHNYSSRGGASRGGGGGRGGRR